MVISTRTSDKLHDFVRAVESATGCTAKETHGNGRPQYMLRCPAHDDRQASLSVSQGDSGAILIKCFAQCSAANVAAAVGWKLADLLPPLPDPPARGNDKGRIAAKYDYRSADGHLLYQVCRFSTKDFRQRRPDGNGGWVWNVQGVQLVPYRLPELLAAPADEWVFICEGEKDCDNLAALRLCATCNVGGAGKWKPQFNEYFRDRMVCVIADKDAPGRRHARDVARNLHGIAKWLRVVEVPVGKDASDWAAQLPSGTIEKAWAFVGLAESNPEWMPEAAPALTAGTSDETHADRSVLLTKKIDDVEEQAVAWLWDQYIPRGMLTMLVGDPGSGKSYLAQNLSAWVTAGTVMPGTTCRATAGSVLYLAGEDDIARTIKPRLRGAGYPNNGRLHLVQGVQRGESETRGAFNLSRDIRHLEQKIAELGDVRLVVVDTLDCYISGLDGNKAENARAVTTPLAALAERHDLAVVCVRHLNKSVAVRAIHKIVGSVSWVGAARAVHLVAPHPEDPDLRYLVCVKLNIDRKPKPLGFRIESGYRLSWVPVADDVCADDLIGMAPSRGNDGNRSRKVDDARAWLSSFLSSGPRLASDVLTEADKRGTSERTLERAKKRCNVESKPLPLNGDGPLLWHWRLIAGEADRQ